MSRKGGGTRTKAEIDEAAANLSKGKIDRRRIDEQTREQLRADLTATRSAERGGLLSFLNSPFGLFILSSVVLAGLGKFYTDIQARSEERRATRSALIELLSEMDLRSTQALYFARQVDQGPEDTKSYYCVLLWRVLVGDPEYQPTSPSFKNVHWVGLLSKVRVLTDEPDTNQAVRAVNRLELGTNGGRCDRGQRFTADALTLHRHSASLNRTLHP